MKKMTYMEVRQAYLDHLVDKYNHAEIPSASLVTEDDPTLLFTTAGMVPLVPYLMGEHHPDGMRLANSQRCVRTIDIDDVGDFSHLTAFEMLGNWSLGDYFKDEAIKITITFLTEVLEVPMDKLYASVFEGNENAPQDDESIRIYQEIFREAGLDAEVGVQERIHTLNAKENWWGLPSGGPCGPNTEIFYDMGGDYCSPECNVSCTCGKFVELGNNVIMEYLNTNGVFTKLETPMIDFGAGLDRIAMMSQGKKSVYDIDIRKPILDKVIELSEEDIIESQRIIVDHISSATWMIMDGIYPGRTEREYVLRRLIRRAIRHGKKLGIEAEFTAQIAEVAIDQFKVVWEHLDTKREEILQVLTEEEQKFNRTLERGLIEVGKLAEKSQGKIFINEDAISFKIFETHGFPPEMLIEELENAGVEVDTKKLMEEHNKAFKQHQDKSRTAAAGFFKGGLADTSEESKKLHSATHLLLAALREVVGEHVFQKGSNITPERLRLDFPNDAKLTPEQVEQVENLVNSKIEEGLEVTWEEVDKEEALKQVPFAAFDDKYGDTVKLYKMGDFSVEICGGPHVDNTNELGTFKIKKQESVGAGVKRIKAVLQ